MSHPRLDERQATLKCTHGVTFYCVYALPIRAPERHLHGCRATKRPYMRILGAHMMSRLHLDGRQSALRCEYGVAFCYVCTGFPFGHTKDIYIAVRLENDYTGGSAVRPGRHTRARIDSIMVARTKMLRQCPTLPRICTLSLRAWERHVLRRN